VRLREVVTGREWLDRREDAGYPRGGSAFDGFGLFGGFRSRRQVQRCPGTVIELSDTRICIKGPAPHGELRERCFRLNQDTDIAGGITLDEWITIIYRGPYALKIERG